ncbi:MAG: septum formation protein Maf [Anaerolineaceae bacterium]|nr:septum formation protein Maf [Anaerolineaceae bacterium]
MTQCKFWLASNSPRRKEMLTWAGWDLKVSASNINESRHSGESAAEYVLRLASEKAAYPIQEVGLEDIVIAADTIVVLDGEILGKPADEEEAYEMLSRLRARAHWVMTAIAVRKGSNGRMHQDICRTRVQMRKYTNEEIQQYISGGDPMDKAGAYAIQNAAFHPVVNFNGCFASVMGMPLCHLERILLKFFSYKKSGLAEICQKYLNYNCSITSRIMDGEDVG